mmetsp:Transcript_10175/g.30096  ORF Transcript_10175/g.30096 Transcript_10175/m.30096 type:complete len:274 (+) Transcript_10175:456-1277(+)
MSATARAPAIGRSGARQVQLDNPRAQEVSLFSHRLQHLARELVAHPGVVLAICAPCLPVPRQVQERGVGAAVEVLARLGQRVRKVAGGSGEERTDRCGAEANRAVAHWPRLEPSPLQAKAVPPEHDWPLCRALARLAAQQPVRPSSGGRGVDVPFLLCLLLRAVVLLLLPLLILLLLLEERAWAAATSWVVCSGDLGGQVAREMARDAAQARAGPVAGASSLSRLVEGAEYELMTLRIDNMRFVPRLAPTVSIAWASDVHAHIAALRLCSAQL